MNLTVSQQLTLHKALEIFGVSNQVLMIEEESQELSLAIHKFLHRDQEKYLPDVIDEAADVLVLIKQLEIIVGKDKIEQRVNFKIDRLRKRLKKYEFDMEKHEKQADEFRGFLSQHGYSVRDLLQLAETQTKENDEIFWGCLIGIRFGELTISRIIDPLENSDWGEFHPICKVQYGDGSLPGGIVKWYTYTHNNGK